MNDREQLSYQDLVSERLVRTAPASWWMKNLVIFRILNDIKEQTLMSGYADVTAETACFGGDDGQSIRRTLYVIEVYCLDDIICYKSLSTAGYYM